MSNPIKLQIISLPEDIAQDEALELLVSSMCADMDQEEQELLLEAVELREETSSTYLENGLAVPHGRVNILEEMNISIGLSQTGIAWPEADQTAHMIVLLGVPSKMVTAYLTTMQKLLRWYKNFTTAAPYQLTPDQLKEHLLRVLN